MKDWRIFSTEFLRKILKIFLRLKCSSWCGGSMASNGGLRRSSIVLGGEKWGFRVWVAFLEKRRVKIRVFQVEDIFITCKSCLAHLWALSATSSLLELGLAHLRALNATSSLLELGLAHILALSTTSSLLELHLARHSRLSRDQKLLFSKSRRSDYGNMS